MVRNGPAPAKACPCCDRALHQIGEDIAERLDVVRATVRPIELGARPGTCGRFATISSNGCGDPSDGSPTRRPRRCSIRGGAGPRPASCGPKLRTWARDDRPWGGGDPSMVAYVYAADRKPVLSFAEAAQRAEAHLGDFADVLQVDGYGGYLRPRGADGRSGSPFVGRTYVVCSNELADTSPVATDVLCRIAMLYAIQSEVRGSSVERFNADANGDDGSATQIP